MATLCKNCNHALVYDPAIRKLSCAYCGSQFAAEEVESQAKKYRETERVMTRDEVFGDDEAAEEFLEGYVYTCSECGGEIVIHGTEASTKCIYCGNPNVVFSRVAKEKMPDFIIPFSVTREQALASIKQIISRSAFLPKEVKEIDLQDIRGIYLPYWIVNAQHEEAALVRVKSNNGITKYQLMGRTGTMFINNFPIDGCRILSDESSTRLEPFDLTSMKPFDEDYLLGFYSNSSDITYEEMYLATERRGKEIFEEVAKKDTGSGDKIDAEMHQTSVLNDYKYAMFPVWFVTFVTQGTPHTILVNGQTGKVVCGLPWDKKKFWRTTIIGGILMAAAAIGLLIGILHLLGVNGSGENSAEYTAGRFVVGLGMLLAMVWAVLGSQKLSKVSKQIKRTQSDMMFRFARKRQE